MIQNAVGDVSGQITKTIYFLREEEVSRER